MIIILILQTGITYIYIYARAYISRPASTFAEHWKPDKPDIIWLMVFTTWILLTFNSTWVWCRWTHTALIHQSTQYTGIVYKQIDNPCCNAKRCEAQFIVVFVFIFRWILFSLFGISYFADVNLRSLLLTATADAFTKLWIYIYSFEAHAPFIVHIIYFIIKYVAHASRYNITSTKTQDSAEQTNKTLKNTNSAIFNLFQFVS